MANSPKFLTQKTVKASSWIIGHKVLARASGVVKLAVTARILTPAQFGIFGLSTVALSLIETMSEAGIDQALIQQKNPKPSDFAGAWVINIVRGFLVTTLLLATASFVGDFFKNDAVIPLIQLLSLAPLIKGFKNPNIVTFQRELRFSPEFWLRTMGTLAELVIGILVTLSTRSPLGLVASTVAGSVGETATSFLLAPSPHLRHLSKNAIKKLLRFGRWLWGSSVLSYIGTQGDDIVIGRLLPPAALGLYQNAYKIASLPATQITGVVSQVALPAFSSIQADSRRLKRAFAKVFISTSVITIASSFGIFFLAAPLTRIFLGVNWLPLVPTLKILTIYGLIRAVSSTVGPLFKAVGKPHIITTYGILFVAALMALIIPFTRRWGIEGSAWAVVIAAASTQPYLIWQTFKILKRGR